MAQWQRKILLNPEWDQAKDGTISNQLLALSIANKLRALKPFGGEDADLDDSREDIIADFESMSRDATLTTSEFDNQMGALFDWGDQTIGGSGWNGKKACWIDTMSPANKSPAAALQSKVSK